MMRYFPYDRARAVRYAQQWAKESNPVYPDICGESGNSTYFASQCIFAGSHDDSWPHWSKKPDTWSSPEALYAYLLRGKGYGPRAVEVYPWALQPGDMVQLRSRDGFWRSLVVVSNIAGEVRVAAHAYRSGDRPLDSYPTGEKRCLHILDVQAE